MTLTAVEVAERPERAASGRGGEWLENVRGMKRWSWGLLMGWGLSLGVCAQTTLLAVSPGPGHPVYDVVATVLPEALRPLGYDVVFETLPLLRAARMVDTSAADLYPFSDADYGVPHPRQVRVDVPVAVDEFVVYATQPDFPVDGWSSLKPYTVGYLVGMAAVEARLTGLKSEPSQTAEQAFNKLSAGRCDVVVLPRLMGQLLKKRYPEVRQLRGKPLMRVPLYVYLSPQRADLALPLARALGKLDKSGRLRQVTEQVEAGL